MRRMVVLFLAMAFVATTSASWAQTCIDATEMFAEQAREFADKFVKESRAENDLRVRGIAQYADIKPPEVGDVQKFFVTNVVTREPEEREAVLRKVGENCYLYLEKGQDLPVAVVDKIVGEFDKSIYPTNTKWFGSEWKPGIDGDPRITLLLVDVRDGYDPANGKHAFVGGYFFPGDEYTKDKFMYSNEREMLILDINPSQPGSDQFMGTLAHEFQHLIHWHHDPKEAVWLNEAMSQLAAYLNFKKHVPQIIAFTRNPDNSLVGWLQEDPVADYGHVYLFAYYLLTHVVGRDDTAQSAYFRALVADPARGMVGVQHALDRAGDDLKVSHVFGRMCVANYVNDPSLDDGRYAYDNSLGRLKLAPSIEHKVLPYEGGGEVKFWSADAVTFDLTPLQGELRFTFNAESPVGNANLFGIAVVFTDNRQRTAPRLVWLDVKNNTVAQTIAGVTGAFTSAEMIIINRGPVGVPEDQYAKKPAVAYRYSVTATGNAPVVAMAPAAAMKPRRVSARTFQNLLASMLRPESDGERERAVAALSTQYAEAPAATSNPVAPGVPFGMADRERNKLLLDTVKHGLANKNLEVLSTFNAVWQSAKPGERERLQSLRQHIDELVRFEKAQNGDPALRDALKTNGY